MAGHVLLAPLEFRKEKVILYDFIIHLLLCLCENNIVIIREALLGLCFTISVWVAEKRKGRKLDWSMGIFWLISHWITDRNRLGWDFKTYLQKKRIEQLQVNTERICLFKVTWKEISISNWILLKPNSLFLPQCSRNGNVSILLT